MAKGITVKPIIIQWAIQSAGKDVSGLSDKFDKIDKWTSEESELTVSELNKLSKELRIPFGYFFLPEPDSHRTFYSPGRFQVSADGQFSWTCGKYAPGSAPNPWHWTFSTA